MFHIQPGLIGGTGIMACDSRLQSLPRPLKRGGNGLHLSGNGDRHAHIRGRKFRPETVLPSSRVTMPRNVSGMPETIRILKHKSLILLY